MLSFRKSIAPLALFVIALSSDAAAQKRLIVTGPGEGHPPVVNIIVHGQSGDDQISFLAYQRGFTGGVRVATGDVNGDTFLDVITAPGPGMATHIKVFAGSSLRKMQGRTGHFLAYPGFQGGVFVAAGDVDGDGRADIITGADAGGPPHVKVFDPMTGKTLHSFLAYDRSFTGGVRVAAGDVDGDGVAEIITGPGPGGGPLVKVFSGVDATELSSFFAYDQNFTGGVFVAVGDINGDGLADIITGAGPGSGPHVKVFDPNNQSELHGFFAFDPSFAGGVQVAAGDVTGDGVDDLIAGAGPGSGPHVKVFDPNNQRVLHDFFAYPPAFLGGVYVGGFSAPRPR